MSALDAPRWAFHYGQADIVDLAAVYFNHLMMNHPFVDGNKRVGTAAALVFLVDKAPRGCLRYALDACKNLCVDVVICSKSAIDKEFYEKVLDRVYPLSVENPVDHY